MLITLMFILSAKASVCEQVLTANKMQAELTFLTGLASKMSDAYLLHELDLHKAGREDFELIGIEFIPMSLMMLSERPALVSKDPTPFIELWNADVWTYVLMRERERRFK